MSRLGIAALVRNVAKRGLYSALAVEQPCLENITVARPTLLSLWPRGGRPSRRDRGAEANVAVRGTSPALAKER